MRVDKFSMQHSLEARAPFLDHALATYALSLPAGMKIDGTRTKAVLKDAARDWLPDDVIERIRTRGDLSTIPARYARAARVVQHVLAYESIPQDLQDQVKGDLGMPGLVELVTLAGQYRLIAGVLFAFDSPLPEGTPPPF